jgi:tetratricopeptide (TPR) repeat protein
MVKATLRALALLLVSDLFFGGCPTSFGQSDDPSVPNQQAINLYKEGKYQEAIPIAEKVLDLDKKILGPENPLTVIAIGNLAILYNSIGDYAKAEPFYLQVLLIREKLLGPDNPDTAAAMNNLALVYDEMGDYSKAEPLYQQALEVKTKVLGREHPDCSHLHFSAFP